MENYIASYIAKRNEELKKTSPTWTKEKVAVTNKIVEKIRGGLQ